MKKIESIRFVRTVDTDPDTSWMGDYSKEPKHEYSIDRQTKNFFPLREARYFNAPVENYEGESEENIKKYAQQDFERMETLNEGEWNFLGISAEAKIMTSSDGSYWLTNKIKSGGLWGVESDCGESDMQEVFDEQLSDLEDVLLEFGFSQEEIDTVKKTMIKEARDE